MVGVPLGRRGEWVPHKSGVKFRTIIHEDGTTERWRQPKLAPWQVRAAILLSLGHGIPR
jgi:hypothetical protein